MSNQQLGEELLKPVIRTFEKRKVHSSFRDNIQGTALADMKLISKDNTGICNIVMSMQYWAVPLKYERFITIANAFQKI